MIYSCVGGDLRKGPLRGRFSEEDTQKWAVMVNGLMARLVKRGISYHVIAEAAELARNALAQCCRWTRHLLTQNGVTNRRHRCAHLATQGQRQGGPPRRVAGEGGRENPVVLASDIPHEHPLSFMVVWEVYAACQH